MYCHLLPSLTSVAYVSRSGGMSNELNNIISRTTNGVYEGVAIGGDRYATRTCSGEVVQNCILTNQKIVIHDHDLRTETEMFPCAELTSPYA